MNSCININDHLAQQAFDLTGLIGIRVVVAVVYCFIFCVGVFGNAGVMIKVASNRKLHSARNIFLMNLMASDFLLCLTAVPFTPISVITKQWIFGGVICRLIPLCQSMSVIITSLSLTAIAVDKYIHIMDVTRGPVTLGRACVVVGIIWTIACALNLPLVLSYDVFDGALYYEEYGVAFCGEFCDEIHWSSSEYKQVYGTSVMCIQFVLPMLVIMFCYMRIMRKVGSDMMIDNKQFSKSLSAIQRTEAMKKKKRVNYILIMMVVAFIGAWFPLTLFNILRDYSLLPNFISNQPFLWALIVHSTAMTTVIWNPLLFFWLTARPRRRRRSRASVDSSVLLNFLLASNPFDVFLKNRRKCRDDPTGAEDDFSTFDATFTDHELSTTPATYSSTTMVVYKADSWIKKKFSKNSNRAVANFVSEALVQTKSPEHDVPRITVYANETTKLLNALSSTTCASTSNSGLPGRLMPESEYESLTEISSQANIFRDRSLSSPSRKVTFAKNVAGGI